MKELKSKEIIFNHHQIHFLFWFLCALVIFIFELIVFNEFFISIVGIPLVILLFILILISPTHYIFYDSELIIKHFCGLKENIKYNEINSIYEMSESGTRGWIKPFKNYYIAYPHKKKFLLCSEVCKSKKAKRLLEYYTNIEIK